MSDIINGDISQEERDEILGGKKKRKKNSLNAWRNSC